MKALPDLFSMGLKLFADAGAVKWPTALAGAALGYFLPTQAQQGAALAAAHFVILDTVTGIVAAKISGKPITSARLGRVLVKLLAYSSVLSVIATVVNHIPGAQVAQGPSITGTLSFVLLTEGVSILENVRAMGFTLPFGLEPWLAGRLPRIEPPAAPPAS